MKKLIKGCLLALAAFGCLSLNASDLVILTTNDTHSNIDSDANGVGGILPRKAIVDSVRKAEKNVLLVDAGDMVQGTLYFKYFHGDVEYPLFNMMDYDVRILGNHEFDNGLDELAKYWRDVKASRLSANYDFKGTKAEGIFQPYVIKKVDGKKIGFIGLNVDPESLISTDNYKGMKFLPVIETANKTAAYLKKDKKCDLVVAVTHIGYTSDNGKVNDVELARASRDIDIIIGGHSHTFVDPSKPSVNPCVVDNAAGRPVLVTQTGKYGKNIGYIKIDLDHPTDVAKMNYEYIPVTDRFPASAYDKRMMTFLAPYKHVVDSVNNTPIGYSIMDMANDERDGAYAHWSGDMAMQLSRLLADSIRATGNSADVDFAIMNVGGIRQKMHKGIVTEGQMLSTFPFSNRLQLVELKGRDIIDGLAVAARKGGEAISGNVRVLSGKNGDTEVVINGEPMNPDKTYRMMTIDYVAQGNDDLTPLANNKTIWRDSKEVSARVLDYVRYLTALGLPVEADTAPRFLQKVSLNK